MIYVTIVQDGEFEDKFTTVIYAGVELAEAKKAFDDLPPTHEPREGWIEFWVNGGWLRSEKL